MKEKIKNWLDMPITKRGCVKIFKWCFALSTLAFAVLMCYNYIEDIKAFFEKVIDKVKAVLGFDKTDSKDSNEFDV